MPRRPDEEGSEPEGGGAAERLRQHLESRFEPDDWPEDAATEDLRRRPAEGTGAATSDEAGEPGLPIEPDDDDGRPALDSDDAEESPRSLELDEREEPPESNPDELTDDEGED